MAERVIVFFGDCQAQALAHLYRRFVAALTRERVRYIDVAQETSEEDLESLAKAGVLVSQVSDVQHNKSLDAVSSNAQRVEFPAVFAGFFWPYSGQSPHPRNVRTQVFPHGPYGAQVSDIYLNKMILEGVEPDEALRRYLDHDIAKAAHLDQLFEIDIGAQAARDKRAAFSLAPIIEENFRDTQLFLTFLHPTLPMMVPLLRGVFERLGVPQHIIERIGRTLRLTPFPLMALPIHPGVIRHFGLSFVSEHSRYPFFDEGAFTFGEFVIRYMTYAHNAELEEGLQLARSPNTSRADGLLERALKSSPGSIEGWRTMSRLLREMGRLAEAQPAATRAVELDPENPNCHAELGRVLLEMKNFAGAEAAFRNAAEIEPSAEFRGLLADAIERQGRRAEAICLARQIIAEDLNNPHAYGRLGRYLAREGDFAGAETAFRNAVDIKPLAGFRAGLADAIEGQGRRPEAIGIVRQIVAEDAKAPHMYARLGHYLAREEDFAGAEAAFRNASELAPLPSFRANLADAIERQGRRAEAIGIVQQIIAEGTTEPRLYGRLGHYLFRERDFAGAAAAFRAALKLGPSLDFERNLAEAVKRQGVSEAAVATSASHPDSLLMGDRDLVLNFESLGDNCELGIVQRRVGAEPLGLLRFAGAPLRNLLRAMEARFEGLADPDNIKIEAGPAEYMVKLSKYGIVYHAQARVGKADPEALHAQQTRTLPFLIRKLINDLENPTKILVFKQNETVHANDLFDLLATINRFGPSTLLWVQEARPHHPPGTVEIVHDQLMFGYVQRLAHRARVPELDLPSWLLTLRRAYELWRDKPKAFTRTTQPPLPATPTPTPPPASVAMAK